MFELAYTSTLARVCQGGLCIAAPISFSGTVTGQTRLSRPSRELRLKGQDGTDTMGGHVRLPAPPFLSSPLDEHAAVVDVPLDGDRGSGMAGPGTDGLSLPGGPRYGHAGRTLPLLRSPGGSGRRPRAVANAPAGLRPVGHRGPYALAGRPGQHGPAAGMAPDGPGLPFGHGHGLRPAGPADPGLRPGAGEPGQRPGHELHGLERGPNAWPG